VSKSRAGHRVTESGPHRAGHEVTESGPQRADHEVTESGPHTNPKAVESPQAMKSTSHVNLSKSLLRAKSNDVLKYSDLRLPPARALRLSRLLVIISVQEGLSNSAHAGPCPPG
jgi:hypothetical protein